MKISKRVEYVRRSDHNEYIMICGYIERYLSVCTKESNGVEWGCKAIVCCVTGHCNVAIKSYD